MDYGDPDGRHYPNHPLAEAFALSRSTLLKKQNAQNNGPHRTAHKLPKLRGIAMTTPVTVAHYCACALSGGP